MCATPSSTRRPRRNHRHCPRHFRRQHLEKFLPGLHKLGLQDEPDAPAGKSLSLFRSSKSAAPTANANNVTPHSEAFQAVVWHLFVSHPDLKLNQTKWESVAKKP